jgi:hypothetical protein
MQSSSTLGTVDEAAQQPEKPEIKSPAQEGKEIIQKFLDNFNYINKSGKRNGFFLCKLFFNKALTARLEETAKYLRAHLHAIASPERPPLPPKEKGKPAVVDTWVEPSFEDKWRGFMATVNQAFKDATTARAEHGSQCTDIHHNDRFNIDGYYASYKKPYKPSKFETDLVCGLEAVSKELDTRAQAHPAEASLFRGCKAQCDNLAQTIREFKPKEQVIARTPNL